MKLNIEKLNTKLKDDDIVKDVTFEDQTSMKVTFANRNHYLEIGLMHPDRPWLYSDASIEFTFTVKSRPFIADDERTLKSTVLHTKYNGKFDISNGEAVWGTIMAWEEESTSADKHRRLQRAEKEWGYE